MLKEKHTIGVHVYVFGALDRQYVIQQLGCLLLTLILDRVIFLMLPL